MNFLGYKVKFTYSAILLLDPKLRAKIVYFVEKIIIFVARYTLLLLGIELLEKNNRTRVC